MFRTLEVNTSDFYHFLEFEQFQPCKDCNRSLSKIVLYTSMACHFEQLRNSWTCTKNPVLLNPVAKNVVTFHCKIHMYEVS